MEEKVGISKSRSVSRAQSGSSVGQHRKTKSTLSWADTVSGGGGTGPSHGPRDRLPEQARDAEVACLRKGNVDIKDVVRKMAGEITEIKKLVITQSVSAKVPVPIATEALAPASDSSGAPKRRALCSKDESGSQISEVKNMLAMLSAGQSNERGILQSSHLSSPPANIMTSRVSDADIVFEYIDEKLQEELDDLLLSFCRPDATMEERLADYKKILQIQKIMAM
ncbi:hypothetical protein HPB50_001948 [Hyalomma asiaticum]|uniref:Uncharacterized protein n=1 Tax=Hyalomma asiaticum TaxID=266040 RepID=A0ACB7T9G3_HYAAI|nr:hypothetical protein HPB50_001948 [Hyalomma asiaticum]